MSVASQQREAENLKKFNANVPDWVKDQVSRWSKERGRFLIDGEIRRPKKHVAQADDSTQVSNGGTSGFSGGND